MFSGGQRLGHLEPRERAGAQTGRKYEYQYERTARAALDLLAEDAKHVCVYCDWHDDYVVETGQPPTRYVFHQVKGRKSSQGPWKFSAFLVSR
jgi:Cap4 dsDNA endonuclease